MNLSVNVKYECIANVYKKEKNKKNTKNDKKFFCIHTKKQKKFCPINVYSPPRGVGWVH